MVAWSEKEQAGMALLPYTFRVTRMLRPTQCSLIKEVSMHRRFPFVALLPLLVLVCNANDKKKNPDEIGNRDIGKGVNFYSIEKEMALGKMLADQVERESKIVKNDKVSEYVNRVAQNLARNSDSKMP